MSRGAQFTALLFVLLVNVAVDADRFRCSRERSCGCGRADVEINAKIIGGEEAVPSSWSMLASVRYDFLENGNPGTHMCGGTILTESYVLTTASCFDMLRDPANPRNVTIATGMHRRSQPRPIVREVDQIIRHSSWSAADERNGSDIALLHLSEPLDLGEDALVTRTCLAPQLNTSEELLQYPSADVHLVTVGWGRKTYFGDNSDPLHQLFVFSIDPNHSTCADVIRDPQRQFCTGLEDTNTGPCYGDFGGPIFQWMDDHWQQVGIASTSADACAGDSAISYTRLAFYRDWIDTQMARNEALMNRTTPSAISTAAPTTTPTRPTVYRCDKSAVPCGCGRRNVAFSPAHVAVGDHEATAYSWSMVVSIRVEETNKHACSGSILSNSFVLTSATCLAGIPSYGLTVVAGLHRQSDETGTRHRVDRVYLHPNYTGMLDNYAHDVAILHVSEPFDLENDLYVSSTCLLEKDSWSTNPIYYPWAGSKLAVVGWGTMKCLNDRECEALEQLEVFATDYYEKSCYILDKHRGVQFCAGLLGIKDAAPCVGDAGSPIFLWSYDRWQQVGIASHMFDHPAFRSLSIYTRTVEYHDWIQSIIRNCSDPVTSTTTTPVHYSTTTATKPLPVSYPCNRSSTCGCGMTSVVLTPSRIVGGENAMESSWPMIVSMRRPNADSHWCGGSILSATHILTAAHCLVGYASNPPVNVTVAVGMTNLSDPNRIVRDVEHIYNHPEYIGSSDNFRHDIAILRLNQSLPLNSNLLLSKTCIHRVRPPVQSVDYVTNGTRLSVIGWGTMTPYVSDVPDVLQQVEVQAIDNNDPICQSAQQYPELQFCAGLHVGGKDSCQGDSGGPIFQWTGQYWEQVGIVSHGEGCAIAGKPGIYTRLSYYYDWINDILMRENEHIEPVSTPDTTGTSSDLSSTASVVNVVTTGVTATAANGASFSAKSSAAIHRNLAMVLVLVGCLCRERLFF